MGQDVSTPPQAGETPLTVDDGLRLLLNQIPAVLWTTDTDLRLTAAFGTGLANASPGTQQVEGIRLAEFWHIEDTEAAVIVAHRRALRGESVSQEIQYEGRRLQAHIVPLRHPARGIIGTIGVALDLTERLQQEQERQHMACEVYSDIAQMMVSAQQHLDTSEALWQCNQALARSHLERGLDRLMQAIVEARRVLAQLLPQTLETPSLMPAVRRYLGARRRQHGGTP